MPNFDIAVAGGTVEIWEDEPGVGPGGNEQPSRINPRKGLWLRRLVHPVGTLHAEAVVGGVQGPLDAALGGKLFLWDVIEYPTPWHPGMITTPGQTSVIDIECPLPGHYTFQAYRENGGSVIVHVDVQA